VGILRHGGPLLVERLGGCPTPTTWQASGGDRYLNFYGDRDNLNPDPDHAQHELEALARGLTRQRPGAAASLREGLAETLTVNRLGVGGKLLQTLESTNPVESMIEIVRDHAGRVKRWSSGEMALRWAAAGMLAAEAQFRRVKGYQELPQLAAALQHATADEPGLLDLAVTA
jgi:hypothetical protein